MSSVIPTVFYGFAEEHRVGHLDLGSTLVRQCRVGCRTRPINKANKMSEVSREQPKYLNQPKPVFKNRDEKEAHHWVTERNKQIASKLNEIRNGPASSTVV